MLRLRHLLHPVRSASSLYRAACQRVSCHIHRRLAERQIRQMSIRRGQVDRCWCGGELLPFKWHASYGVCRNCRTYVNRRPPVVEELEGLYSLSLYWRTIQRLKGYPTIEN